MGVDAGGTRVSHTVRTVRRLFNSNVVDKKVHTAAQQEVTKLY